MEIKIDRFFKGDTYTIGRLYIDGQYFCDTLEDTCRNLRQDMTDEQIRHFKVAGKTAIPVGRYRVRLKRYSPRFGKRKFYQEVCKGFLPYLENVKGYIGILIHCGNDEDDTEGCILIGKNDIKGKVVKSQLTFKAFYKRLKEAEDAGEEIWITIA